MPRGIFGGGWWNSPASTIADLRRAGVGEPGGADARQGQTGQRQEGAPPAELLPGGDGQVAGRPISPGVATPSQATAVAGGTGGVGRAAKYKLVIPKNMCVISAGSRRHLSRNSGPEMTERQLLEIALCQFLERALARFPWQFEG